MYRKVKQTNLKLLSFMLGMLIFLSGIAYMGAPMVAEAAADQWVNVGSAGFSSGSVESTSIAVDSSGTPYVVYRDGGNSYKATVMKYNGSSWENVGSAGFSSGSVESTSIVIDSSGTPYVVYRDLGNGNKATVMKYNGSSWVNVGFAGFSSGSVEAINIATDSSGTPYVVYIDVGNDYKATVMKYNGSSWVNVGSAGFTSGEASYTSIAIDSSGTPYIVYMDGANSFKATAMKYNGSSWENVGSAGFSSSSVTYTTIAIGGSGTPYVVYKDSGNSNKATVMKYNGNSWENVGSTGFSSGVAIYTSIAIDSSGTPYVVYQDGGNSIKATVMKYNGSSWENVGSAGYSSGSAYYTSIAIDSSGTPYVAYQDISNSSKANVMKLTKTYTLTYDGNVASSGSVPTDNSGYHAGGTATVLGNTLGLVKTGYTFRGWNTKADGTGTDYAADDSISIGSADVRLFAKWSINAKMPNITTQPANQTVNEGDSSPSLSVAATVSDGGTLSYQWYSNVTSSNSGGTVISGATSALYAVPTTAAGTTYYYVVLTNTNNSATGSQTATVTSNAVTVTVNALTNAAVPSIGAQPTGATVNEGDSSLSLSVAVTVSDGGTLSYQWYNNATSSNSSGTAISGATSALYAAPTTTVGTTYYYVVVTNTNSSATGSQTATVTSSVATVTVNALTNAIAPSIGTQPTGATVNEGDSSPSLSVAATVSDGGTLSYQWYSNATSSNISGTAISGATSLSYAAPTTTAGTTYYYVVVTNTNNSATGSQTATATSSVATVTVNALTNAAAPSIGTQPTGATVNEGDSSPSLSVAATVSDGGTLSYQWYSNATNSNSGGTVISGATSLSYAAPTTTVGTTYYYVVVTNTNSSATGNQTATEMSNAVTVTVNVLTNAVAPSIGTQPTGATVNEGDSSPSLSVAATVSDGGTLSYQWYSNAISSNSSGTAISGATSALYAAPTTTAGTTYYYVVVTNTNSSATGNKTATAPSSIATVTVNVLTNAVAPSIGTQPTGATVNEGDSSPSLSVAATVSDGGTLSYQWYSNAISSNSSGTAINGATSALYAAPTTTAGTTYYYVVVTNTNSSATGNKTAKAPSSVATVMVNALTNAIAPSIGTQPTGATVNEGDSSPSLIVAATVSDGGTLSYQWYSNTTSSNSSGTAISGATSALYAAPTTAAGTTYYYVVVTNTNSSATGNKTATASSSVATVMVNALTNAIAPSIGTQPTGATVNEGDSSPSLIVAATVSDGGTLSYQWHSNTTSSNSGGTAISGATSLSYAAPTTTAGTTYYYVMVTNTNNSATGSQTATATSSVATVTVNALTNAAAPSIGTQPTGATVNEGDSSPSLIVAATVSDGGTLSYQWYSNTTSSNSGGTVISGATNLSYAAPTTTAGTIYYYVVVTNTNSSATGNQTATATSSVATVTVNTLTNATAPSIGTQPTGATVNEGDSSPSLSVAATVSDGGTLSYQWYSNTTSSNSGGTVISGATSLSYAAPTTTVGTTYYYVVVTNTNSSATGNQTATETSSVATVTVNTLTNATAPSIGTQPTGATVNEGDSSLSLSVAATVSDGGTLNYQWYSNTTSSNSGGTVISSATSLSYAAPTTTAGTTYYYVVVTNTNNSATGSQTATATSSVATVTVNALTNVIAPSIGTQPTGVTVNEGDSSPSLSVAATVSDGGTLSYQWYINTTNSNSGGTAISGATSASYAVPTTAAGTTYYYCVVTNTDTSTTGSKTATVISNVAKLTVNATVISAPLAPTGLTAIAGNGQIALTWNGVSDTVTYSVYEGTASGSYGLSPIMTVSGATNSYTATGLTNGTTYYFAVKANNEGENSNYSNEVSATPSSNANLSSMAVSGITLSPSFDPSTFSYTLSVANGVTLVRVTPTTSDSNAKVKVNGMAVTSGQSSGAISLNVGNNPIIVAVTSQDGMTMQTYTVNVTRAKAITASSNTLIQVTTEPVSISIPASVTNVEIAVAATTAGSSKEATLPLVEVQLATTLGIVSVMIPDGTKITAPANWDGTIRLPQVLSNSSVTINNGNASAVIEVGSRDVSLTFDRAVRLLLPNQGGKKAGFVRNGVLTEITGTVTADSQAAADNEIAAGGDAKIMIGSDLVIWTKHFTQFVSYTLVDSTSNTVNNGGGGGTASNAATNTTTNNVTIVAASGGTAMLNGATIEVPAGAMDSNFQVTIDIVSDTSILPMDSALQLVSEVYEIKKDKDGEFSKPVVITLPFDKTKVDFTKLTAGVYWLNEKTHKWVSLDNSKVDEGNGRISGSVNHFTKFAVLALDKAKTEQPQTSEADFADIKGHWSEANVRELVKLGAINGYSDNTFKPDANITRAEFVTVIVKAFQFEKQEGKTFADTETHWAKSAIATAAAAGIVAGYSDNSFGPDDFITREQMATIVVRATNLATTDKSVHFTDNSDISDWARTALITATSNGMIKGYEDGTVKPKVNTTRAEAVTVILRALQTKK